jgi:hypothetical protein
MSFINAIGKEIGLERPVAVKVVNGDGVTKDWAAYHTFDGRKHFIKIGSRPARGFHNVLAHELAHALADEAYPGTPVHGVEFGVACLIVTKAFRKHGLAVTPFDFEVDV